MENLLTSLIEHSKQAVKYWWLTLLTGIALLVIAIIIFAYPAMSYLGLSMLFGWMILISGIFSVIVATSNKHFITGRGWTLAGGIVEIMLGVILAFNVILSAEILPIFLGFWLMFRGFRTIGLGGDMYTLSIPGATWTIICGILLMICSMWILLQPVVIGTSMVIIWVGISLLFAGIAAIMLAMQLKSAHKHLQAEE